MVAGSLEENWRLLRAAEEEDLGRHGSEVLIELQELFSCSGLHFWRGAPFGCGENGRKRRERGVRRSRTGSDKLARAPLVPAPFTAILDSNIIPDLIHAQGDMRFHICMTRSPVFRAECRLNASSNSVMNLPRALLARQLVSAALPAPHAWPVARDFGEPVCFFLRPGQGSPQVPTLKSPSREPR
jgi:hypothetical protein